MTEPKFSWPVPTDCNQAPIPTDCVKLNWFKIYWPIFYRLVHSPSTFVGVYTTPGPDVGDNSPDPTCSNSANRIQVELDANDLMVTWFNNNPALPKPDLYGIEWYGNTQSNGTSYPLNCISTDLTAIIAHMVSTLGLASSPPDPLPIMLTEGGTNQGTNSLAHQFMFDAISTGAVGYQGRPVAGIGVWQTDFVNSTEVGNPIPSPLPPGQTEASYCSQANPGSSALHPDAGAQSYSLFDSFQIIYAGAKAYVPQISTGWPGWHFPSAPPTLLQERYCLAYGTMDYSTILTNPGTGLANGFCGGSCGR